MKRPCRPRIVGFADVIHGQRWQAVCVGCMWEGPPRSYKPMARIDQTHHKEQGETT